MQNNCCKKGFTLPEILVAISILVLVIFSATSLLISIIRSNNENLNTLVAYGLAQEGIEGVRNIRDSGWLLGANFNWQIKNTNIWGEYISESNQGSFFTIELNSFEDSLPVSDLNQLPDYTPWKLKRIKESDLYTDDTLLKKDDGVFKHTSFKGENSIFRRYVFIEKIDTDYSGFKKFRVESVVKWIEGGRDKTVKLETELTDWYEGQ